MDNNNYGIYGYNISLIPFLRNIYDLHVLDSAIEGGAQLHILLSTHRWIGWREGGTCVGGLWDSVGSLLLGMFPAFCDLDLLFYCGYGWNLLSWSHCYLPAISLVHQGSSFDAGTQSIGNLGQIDESLTLHFLLGYLLLSPTTF